MWTQLDLLNKLCFILKWTSCLTLATASLIEMEIQTISPAPIAKVDYLLIKENQVNAS